VLVVNQEFTVYRESLDNRLVKYLRSGSVSFIKFDPNDLPERCLDLGCGVRLYIASSIPIFMAT
jgi:hypothetical protein